MSIISASKNCIADKYGDCYYLINDLHIKKHK